ncbi:unnamed protein product [Allacma fusca]|uniref:Uncharacterized protein n=1 Tax=Allacma fusca TaxID=39272 RepID=A0A8J2NKD0_9HEXA|nr:unnamed protein product [Allacma fusca]
MARETRGLPYLKRFNSLKWDTVEERVRKLYLTEAYKIINGKYNVDHGKFFAICEGARRPPQLFKSKFKRNARGGFLTNRVINDWNRLGSEVKTSEIVMEFKRKLAKCI